MSDWTFWLLMLAGYALAQAWTLAIFRAAGRADEAMEREAR